MYMYVHVCVWKTAIGTSCPYMSHSSLSLAIKFLTETGAH